MQLLHSALNSACKDNNIFYFYLVFQNDCYTKINNHQGFNDSVYSHILKVDLHGQVVT